MNDQDYRIDRHEIALQNQNTAVEKLQEIERKCNKTPLAFLKSNFNNVKIRERKTEPNFRMLLAVAWSKISTLAGIKSEIDSINIEDITKMIFYSYSDLSIEEIYKAFEMERYGTYDEKTEHFQLFNADYIGTVLKKYKNWKRKTMMEQNISVEKTTEEVSDIEKENILKNGANRMYQEYKQTKNIDGPTEYIFDFLVEKSLIKSGNNPKLLEYYQQKLQYAKIQLTHEHKAMSSTSKTERFEIKKAIADIENGSSAKIIIRAKKNILIEFFEKKIKEEVDVIF